MNTYLIPIYPIKSKEDCEDYYISVIYADSEYQAYEAALYKSRSLIYPFQYILPEYTNNTLYETFYEKLPFDIDFFHISQKNVILEEIFRKRGQEYMKHFNVDWKKYTDILKEKADEEEWSNSLYPNNGILTNYLVHTFKRLKSEKGVISNDEYGLFNTGLFTKYYEEIYAYSDINGISFLTAHELNQKGISDRPKKANYFDDPSLLLFDWHYPIDVHFKHILEDDKNKERFPKGFLEKENKMCILTGAIELMKKKVSANYKLAIPQCYEDKIQLLLPLCLDTDDGEPDLALAVTKLNNCYQGYTCLTLDMAYNNARLIAKPESSWLHGNNKFMK